MKIYDFLIIGAGPAGLSAALYAKRYGLDVIVFDNPKQVSNLALAHDIENYPGIMKIPGAKLLEVMKKQVENLGVKIVEKKIVDIIKNDIFTAKVEHSEYKAKAILLAMGMQNRRANIPGEEEFLGKGVSYCVSCDGPLYKGKTVGVIGGGDCAVEGALELLEKYKANVYLIHRGNELSAQEISQNKLMASNIKILWNSNVVKINGSDRVHSIDIKNNRTGEIKNLEIDGLFIQIGYVPATQLAKKIGVKIDDKGFIIVDKNMNTNIKGVYAAGDITDSFSKQLVTAVDQGAIAAMSAYKEIKGRYKADYAL